jgi:hypothetical protein
LSDEDVSAPGQAGPLHGDDLFAGVGGVAAVVAESNPRNLSAETAGKDLRVEPVPYVRRLDVGREVLDEEARLDDEADLRRVDVALAPGRVRTDGVRLLSEPANKKYICSATGKRNFSAVDTKLRKSAATQKEPKRFFDN